MDTWIDDEIRAREEQMIHETLARYPRPADVHDIQIEFGEDQSGFPAARIKLYVTGTLRPPSPEWDAVFKYSQDIGRALSDRRLRHYPYVKFHPVAQAVS